MGKYASHLNNAYHHSEREYQFNIDFDLKVLLRTPIGPILGLPSTAPNWREVWKPLVSPQQGAILEKSWQISQTD